MPAVKIHLVVFRKARRNYESIKMAIKFLVCKLYHKRARKKPLIYLFVIVEFLMYCTNTGCVFPSF